MVIACPVRARQVDLMARQLEEEGERVLVVLPERYLRPCVPNSARSRRRKVRKNICSPLAYIHWLEGLLRR